MSHDILEEWCRTGECPHADMIAGLNGSMHEIELLPRQPCDEDPA